jgi:hypothetical protein
MHSCPSGAATPQQRHVRSNSPFIMEGSLVKLVLGAVMPANEVGHGQLGEHA